jgi:hypothetical protein
LLLHYFEGLAPARIARLEGIPAATVRSRLARSRELLRQRLETRHGAGTGRPWSGLVILAEPLSSTAMKGGWFSALWKGWWIMNALKVGTAVAVIGLAVVGTGKLLMREPAEAQGLNVVGSEARSLHPAVGDAMRAEPDVRAPALEARG